jgi:hypothetical protein
MENCTRTLPATHAEWNELMNEVNELARVLRNKPAALKIGHSMHPGSILNAYREGDLNFDESVTALSKWKSLSLTPAQHAAEEMAMALWEAKEFIENQQLPDAEWSRVLDVVVAALAKAGKP